MNETDFTKAREGDRVWWFTHRIWGTIKTKSSHSMLVKFEDYPENYNAVDFNLKGERYGKQELFWSEIPIVAPPRPKRKVKKVVEGWQNAYPGEDIPTFYFKTITDAERYAGKSRIACIHLTGEYEVEE